MWTVHPRDQCSTAANVLLASLALSGILAVLNVCHVRAVGATTKANKFASVLPIDSGLVLLASSATFLSISTPM